MSLDPLSQVPDEIPRQCTAQSKRTGNRCRRPAIIGGTVCWHHGGASPQVRAAAQRRLEQLRVEGEVGALLELLGEPDDVDPLEVLLGAVRRAHTRVALYEALVAGLAARPDAGEDGTRPDALYGPDHLGDARPHALELGLRHWQTEAARTAKLALDAGVAAKRVQLEEAMVDQLVTAMQVVSEAIGSAVELAARTAGLDPELVRRARLEAEPLAFRRALEPLAAVEATATERLPEAAKSARDGQQSAT